MLRALIVDDDEIFARYVKKCIDWDGLHTQLLGHARNGAQAVEMVSELEPDIVIMDVEMPGIDGMETARALRQRDRDVVIVFITNIARYAVDGYEVEALDFILKPVNYFTFSVKLDRAVRRARQQARHTVCLQLADGMQMLDTQEIYYLETRDRMLYYHTDKGVFRLRGSLSAAEKELAPWNFVRCNQCYLVNLRYVSGIVRDTVTLAGHSLEISRRCKTAFLAAVAAFVGGGA